MSKYVRDEDCLWELVLGGDVVWCVFYDDLCFFFCLFFFKYMNWNLD